MKISEKLAKFKDSLLNVVFPDGITCIFCGKDIVEGNICPHCAKQNIFNNGNRCTTCDTPIKEGNIICDHCKANKPKFQSCSCPFIYNEITRSAILKLKEDSAKYLAKHFAQFIFNRLVEDNVEFDVILPVPSHPKTIKRRGYNPAKILAEEIGKLANKPTEDILIKTAITRNQKFLNFQERQSNLENTITLTNGNLVKNKKILIVDDIITTGATINACAVLLTKASEIHCCAIARRSL